MNIRQIFDREADNLVITKDRAGDINRHIRLSEMHAVGISGECDIHPIVNDKRDVKMREHRLHFFCEFHELTCTTMFLTQLYNSTAAIHRFIHYPQYISSGRQLPVGDEI